jgi:putative nucleotidyltransferase with HDIG domain
VNRFTIVQRYAIRSAIFVAVMAIALGLVLTYAIRQISLSSATKTAQIIVDELILPHVSDAELAGGALSPTSIAELKSAVMTELPSADIVAIKVWSRGGRLLFSTDSSDRIGKSFGDHEALAKALKGSVSREIATSSNEENENQFEREGAVMEIYSPVKGANGEPPLGVFEIYQSYAPVAASLWGMIGLVWLVIIAGAVPSYLLQLRFVQRTASQLHTAESALAEVNSRLEGSLDELAMHSLGTLQALVAAVDAKDSYTARHSIAVTDYAVAIGKRLGLEQSELESLERAGLLHDVGKIGTPEAILLKPTELTEEEFLVIREHPEMGGHIVETIPFVADLMPVVRSHHERFDGSGYPDGLKGEEIPLLARILAVADAFDAMTSDRPYRKGMPISSAAADMVGHKGVQFDPAIVDALFAALAANEINVVIHDIPMRTRRRDRMAASA